MKARALKRLLLTWAKVIEIQSNRGVKILLRVQFTPLLVLRELLAVCVCGVFLCVEGVCVCCVSGCCALGVEEF